MSAMRKLFAFAKHLVVVLSFMSGFVVGAIFGETVINRFEPPTALTFFLAR